MAQELSHLACARLLVTASCPEPAEPDQPKRSRVHELKKILKINHCTFEPFAEEDFVATVKHIEAGTC